VAGCDDPPTNQGDGTHRHLPGPRGDLRLGESEFHSVVVAQLRRTVCGGHTPVWEVPVSRRYSPAIRSDDSACAGGAQILLERAQRRLQLRGIGLELLQERA
jgi:hypothetical protein